MSDNIANLTASDASFISASNKRAGGRLWDALSKIKDAAERGDRHVQITRYDRELILQLEARGFVAAEITSTVVDDARLVVTW